MEKLKSGEHFKERKLATILCATLFFVIVLIAVVATLAVLLIESRQLIEQNRQGIEQLHARIGESKSDATPITVREKREVLSASESITDIIKAVANTPGMRGLPGPQGPPGRDGRDAVNFPAIDRHVNTTVAAVVGKEMAKVRLAASEIPVVSGAVYTRWGRNECPSGSELIMKGIAAGSYYSASGGSVQYTCLPDDPEYLKAAVVHEVVTTLSAVQYDVKEDTTSYYHNAPCVICQTNRRVTQTMFPAKVRCPDSGWHKDYQGYLMTSPQQGHEENHRQRMDFACVDMEPEFIPGQGQNTLGALFAYVTANCGTGMGTLGACPPYQANRDIPCVVCSK